MLAAAGKHCLSLEILQPHLDSNLLSMEMHSGHERSHADPAAAADNLNPDNQRLSTELRLASESGAAGAASGGGAASHGANLLNVDELPPSPRAPVEHASDSALPRPMAAHEVGTSTPPAPVQAPDAAAEQSETDMQSSLSDAVTIAASPAARCPSIADAREDTAATPILAGLMRGKRRPSMVKRASKAEPLPEGELEGYVYKHGVRRTDGYRQRWVVIRGSQLYYWDTFDSRRNDDPASNAGHPIDVAVHALRVDPPDRFSLVPVADVTPAMGTPMGSSHREWRFKFGDLCPAAELNEMLCRWTERLVAAGARRSNGVGRDAMSFVPVPEPLQPFPGRVGTMAAIKSLAAASPHLYRPCFTHDMLPYVYNVMASRSIWYDGVVDAHDRATSNIAEDDPEVGNEAAQAQVMPFSGAERTITVSEDALRVMSAADAYAWLVHVFATIDDAVRAGRSDAAVKAFEVADLGLKLTNAGELLESRPLKGIIGEMVGFADRNFSSSALLAAAMNMINTVISIKPDAGKYLLDTTWTGILVEALRTRWAYFAGLAGELIETTVHAVGAPAAAAVLSSGLLDCLADGMVPETLQVPQDTMACVCNGVAACCTVSTEAQNRVSSTYSQWLPLLCQLLTTGERLWHEESEAAILDALAAVMQGNEQACAAAHSRQVGDVLALVWNRSLTGTSGASAHVARACARAARAFVLGQSRSTFQSSVAGVLDVANAKADADGSQPRLRGGWASAAPRTSATGAIVGLYDSLRRISFARGSTSVLTHDTGADDAASATSGMSVGWATRENSGTAGKADAVTELAAQTKAVASRCTAHDAGHVSRSARALALHAVGMWDVCIEGDWSTWDRDTTAARLTVIALIIRFSPLVTVDALLSGDVLPNIFALLERMRRGSDDVLRAAVEVTAASLATLSDVGREGPHVDSGAGEKILRIFQQSWTLGVDILSIHLTRAKIAGPVLQTLLMILASRQAPWHAIARSCQSGPGGALLNEGVAALQAAITRSDLDTTASAGALLATLFIFDSRGMFGRTACGALRSDGTLQQLCAGIRGALARSTPSDDNAEDMERLRGVLVYLESCCESQTAKRPGPGVAAWAAAASAAAAGRPGEGPVSASPLTLAGFFGQLDGPRTEAIDADGVL